MPLYAVRDRHTITRHIIIITGASPSLFIFFCAVGPVFGPSASFFFLLRPFLFRLKYPKRSRRAITSITEDKICPWRSARNPDWFGGSNALNGEKKSKPKNNCERKWPSVREVDWVIYFYRQLIVFIRAIPGQAWWRRPIETNEYYRWYDVQ